MEPLFYIACKGSGGGGAQSTFTYEGLVVFFESMTEELFYHRMVRVICYKCKHQIVKNCIAQPEVFLYAIK